jgi:hypothetical protein
MPIAGTKLFTAGEVLTALDVQYYLMDQTIMGFSSTTTRDAAFGGTGEPTLFEGMFAYTADTDTLWFYDGSGWRLASATLGALNVRTIGGSSSYTLLITDGGKFIQISFATAVTLTVPTNASVAFPIGTQVNIMQLGAGQITIGGAGVTFQSSGSKLKTTDQYSVATLIKTDTDTWVAVGNLTA